MQVHLDRFKAKRALAEKSTQYYYFSDEMLKVIGSNKEASNWFKGWSDGKDLDLLSQDDLETAKKTLDKILKVSEADDEDPKDPKKEAPKVSLVPGTLVLVTDYGTGNEPRKYMWNKSKGEILKKNPDGTFKIRVTDVKDSNVLFSKKWFDQEQKALTQKLNLPRDSFKTLKEIEDAENAEKEEAEQAKVQAEKDKAADAKAKEAEKAKKEKEKADKTAEKEEKEAEKAESVKRMARRLL